MSLLEQLPLPPYTFDPTLSEDENYLTWSVILSRHSFSKRGHMGALLVRPASDASSSSQLLVHAVNTPLLYTTGHPRNVSEIHAEALCLSLAAQRGIAVQGAAVYVTFPPCSECFKLLLMAGIKKLVFRKNYNLHCSDALLVTAEAWGVQVKGTMCTYIADPLRPWPLQLQDDVKARVESLDEAMQLSQLQHLLSLPIDDLTDEQKITISQLSWLQERRSDRQRDERARAFWTDVVGETAVETRQRSAEWWQRWQSIYKQAAAKLRSQNRGGFMEKERKVQKKQRVKQAAEEKDDDAPTHADEAQPDTMEEPAVQEPPSVAAST
ncbi:hypothetical protein ACQY0O_006785 [Thecaphora frezii]